MAKKPDYLDFDKDGNKKEPMKKALADKKKKAMKKGGKVAPKKMKNGGGLYANIAAKKRRIAAGSGEKMKKAGDKGSPTKENFKRAAQTAKKRYGGGLKSGIKKIKKK